MGNDHDGCQVQTLRACCQRLVAIQKGMTTANMHDDSHYSETELKSMCCGSRVREDKLCGSCWNEAEYVVWWRYEMNKTDPVYNYFATQKQIASWVRRVCDLD